MPEESKLYLQGRADAIAEVERAKGSRVFQMILECAPVVWENEKQFFEDAREYTRGYNSYLVSVGADLSPELKAIRDQARLAAEIAHQSGNTHPITRKDAPEEYRGKILRAEFYARSYNSYFQDMSLEEMYDQTRGDDEN